MTTKKDIYKEHLKAWLGAKGDKKKRGEINDHICFVIGVHRKSVPRSFRRLQMRGSAKEERRGRKTYYTPDVTAALKYIWDIASEPCGDNLHPVITEFIEILQKDKQWTYSPETTHKLISMSLGTVKKRVSKFKRTTFLVYGKSTTSPGAIHALIPIRTGPWDDALVGTMQLDTVAHCGGSVAGDFVYTVNATDVATLWGSRRAQWNKGQVETVTSMTHMDAETPFPIYEWHPDSGSEFINWHCKGWCDDRGQMLTRSRPNRKNDNCFVEERNGHVVRRWLGCTRFDVRTLVDATNDVYDVLTPYINHFMASRRTVSKERIGSKWKITRETQAKTPYQRILEREDVVESVKVHLKQEHAQLNPLSLKKEIDRRLKKLFTIQKHHKTPSV